MKISLVMAYYNRKKLLENTLKSIQKYKTKDLEIIIVDDASAPEESILDLVTKYDIKVIEIDRKDKTWINACIPFNIGFSKATGDVIVIQNPECAHMSNILKHVEDNICKNLYLNYACYSIDKDTDYNIKVDDKVAHENGTNGWYNHSIYKPTGYHFCSAIMREDLYALGGFDERYANGLAYDDNEFLHRIKMKKMKIEHIDSFYVVHQFHEGVADRSFVKLGMSINYKIYEKTLKDNGWNVKKHNTYYV